MGQVLEHTERASVLVHMRLLLEMGGRRNRRDQ